MAVAKACKKVLRLNKTSTTKFSFMVKTAYNKTATDFKCGRLKDLSTLKSDIYLGLAALVNINFAGRYILMYTKIDVNDCII